MDGDQDISADNNSDVVSNPAPRKKIRKTDDQVLQMRDPGVETRGIVVVKPDCCC